MEPIILGVTCFLGGCAFVALICFIKRDHENKSSKPIVSEFISWKAALDLMTDYLNNPIYCKNDSGEIEILKGFMLEADQLNEIINLNRNIDQGELVSNVMISFGAKGFIERPIPGTGISVRYPNLKVILTGVKTVNNEKILLIPTLPSDYTDSAKSSICDHASPCPPNCPKPPIMNYNPQPTNTPTGP